MKPVCSWTYSTYDHTVSWHPLCKHCILEIEGGKVGWQRYNSEPADLRTECMNLQVYIVSLRIKPQDGNSQQWNLHSYTRFPSISFICYVMWWSAEKTPDLSLLRLEKSVTDYLLDKNVSQLQLMQEMEINSVSEGTSLLSFSLIPSWHVSNRMEDMLFWIGQQSYKVS